jgi:hypothetical protein
VSTPRAPARPLRACALLIAFPALQAWTPALAAEDNAKPAPNGYYGLLRMRDLSPFVFLRLDMRPAPAVSTPAGSWSVDVELGYQNTWVLSNNVKDYLQSLPGRRALGPGEVQAIQNLPGESYLVDLELGLLDVTFTRKLTDHWSVYSIVSAVKYTGGFLDGTIESFHSAFSFGQAGRTHVQRNDINVILNLKGTQLAQPRLPENGLLDPVIGVRYTGALSPAAWNYVFEAAVKIPAGGERPFLSTGHADFGVQAELHRFWNRSAAYASLAVVHSEGSDDAPSYSNSIIPTLILGYEYRATDRTNLIAQAYASRSPFNHSDTDLESLLKPKYQFSVGVRHRVGASVFTFAITENFGTYGSTPDAGFQIGWQYSPAFAR